MGKLFKPLYEIYINFNYERKGYEAIYVRKHRVLNAIGKEYKCGMLNSFPKDKEDEVYQSWTSYRTYTFDKTKVNDLIKQIRERNITMFGQWVLNAEEEMEKTIKELTKTRDHYAHLRDTFDILDAPDWDDE